MPQSRPSRHQGATRQTAAPKATPKRSFACSPVSLDARSEAAGLEDADVVALLAAEDAESIAKLNSWLKTHSRSWVPVVKEAADDKDGLSPEGACAVLGAYLWRAPVDEDAILGLMERCLDVIAERITESLKTSSEDDELLGPAVAVLTANRRSKPAETAIARLAEAGTGGALVLSRSFDAVRPSLKLCIVRHLKPEDVLQLGDNVVASLGASVAKLSEELEPPQQKVATRFLAALGPIKQLESDEIDVNEPLEPGTQVFHASWGAGVVVAADADCATIDFGSAGTRTLLRSLATLRRAV